MSINILLPLKVDRPAQVRFLPVILMYGELLNAYSASRQGLQQFAKY
ncbi:MAG: hypothetical protein AAFQ63_08805 [Cyanobacteria bacterium J06621_11]